MSRVRVCCRVRPTTLGDAGDVDDCISVTGNGGATDVNVLVSGGTSFQIDAAYGQQATQEELFDGVARPLIDEAFGGINCTLFSYGQTGSGKTFTLQGKAGPLRGILPRAVECIFQQMTALSQGGSDGDGDATSCELHISVMEIYKERLRDLLVSVGPASLTSSWGQGSSGGNAAANLRIRQHADGSVWVEGLTETRVVSEAQFGDMLASALKKRATGSHAMNSESSRSHLVTILSLRQHRLASGQRMSSKIHLIDLAGSEMVRKTDATGNALKEAMHINKSLSALGNVIYALTSPVAGSGAGGAGGDAREKKAHVPYRDSKLTRLLQDSLGGNAKTVLLLAVASARAHMQESVNTLRFGERARQVCTHPRVNADIDDDRVRGALQRAEAQILLLSQTIAAMQLQVRTSDGSSSSSGSGGGGRVDAPSPPVCLQCVARRALEEERPSAGLDASTTTTTTAVAAAATAAEVVDKPAPAAKLAKAVPASTGKPAPSSSSATAKRGVSGKQKPGPARAPVGKVAAAKEIAAPPSSVPVLPQLLSPRPPALPPAAEQAPAPTLAPTPTPTPTPAPAADADTEGPGAPPPASDVTAAEQQLLDAVRRSAANAPGDDDDDDDDLCGRCAVCGLDEEGSARLQDQTGEVLGALFMCDGNCGGTFHARCVNLVGDGGQFQEPEGEWYCATCTVEDGGGPGAAGAASQATLEYLRAEYHAMRRERNRVLTQWQQERNIAEIIDARHRSTNQQRDRDGVLAAERVAALEAELAAERRESGRLRAVSEELLAALQQGSSASGPQSPRRGAALAPLSTSGDAIAPGLFSGSGPGPAPAVSSWQMMLQAESSMLRRSKSGDDAIPAEAETPPPASPPQQRRPRNQKADVEAASSPVPIPLMSLSPQGFTGSLLIDADDGRPDTLDDEPGSSSSTSTSKIKSRLKELLRAVQEEASSFNQITKRHKEREVLRGSRSGSLL